MKLNLKTGRCEDHLPRMAEKSVDVVVTSPPYNLKVKYADYRDDLEDADYLREITSVMAQVHRVLKEEGSLFLNIAGSPTKPLLHYKLLLLLCEQEPKWVLQNTFVWVKSAAVPDKSGGHKTVGHFKPINSGRFVNDCHEHVYHLTKTGNVQLNRKAAGVPYEDQSNLTRWKHTGGKNLRCRGNVWFVPYKTINAKTTESHPARFPAELAEIALRLHNKAGHALDPYNGIGNTGVAAKRVGYHTYTGFDITEDYLEESRRRIAAEEKT